MSDFETLRYEVDGGLARLTLDRPEAMNGMTNRMVREAKEALELAADDDQLRVLVLTGEGRAFCPGADLQHFTSGKAAASDDRPQATDYRVTTLLRKSPTALRGLKAHYVAAERMGLGEFVDFEAERHLKIAASADTAEAFRAFIEKREPRFS